VPPQGKYVPHPQCAPFVIPYLIVTSIILVLILLKNRNLLKKFTAIDYAYMGVGGTLVAVMQHVIGIAIPVPFPQWILLPSYLEVLTAFTAISLVRKFGAGMITMGVAEIIGDTIHYGFGGEPVGLYLNIVTYGLMADIAILLTRNNLFASKNIGLVALEGALLGLAWSVVFPCFFPGFYGPIFHGAIVTLGSILFSLKIQALEFPIIGIVSAIISNRVMRLVA